MSEQLTIYGDSENKNNIPLAEKLRPSEVDQILGQNKILSEDSLLYRMIEQDQYQSFILWGPPGSGKTTIAKLIQSKTKHSFLFFSAVFSSIKEVKTMMKEAEFLLKSSNRKTIIFIDEIHRFNKAQQDAFLPYVESGAVILIGATTENPSFEVISALLSRCHVLVLDALTSDSIYKILTRAVSILKLDSKISRDILVFLSNICNGDARRAINYFEMIVKNVKDLSEISIDEISRILNKNSTFYDKNGEEHYNLISALHKSLRGSDTQAAIYWLARMLEGGEDPKYIVRRLIRFSTEDIGLADPNALVQATSAKEAIHFLGMPESTTILTQLVVYLATAPKSNSAYVAYKAAVKDVELSNHLPPPLHIRNAPTKLMKKLGYGKEYQYSHDHENHYFYQKYFPDDMKEKVYYEPSNFGFEKDINKRLNWWGKLKEKQLKENKGGSEE